MNISRERKGAWMDVFPMSHGKNLLFDVEFVPTGENIKLNPKLAEHVEKSWVPKAESGWVSSWIPFIREISYKNEPNEIGDLMTFNSPSAIVELGSMKYKEIDGINDAIENGLEFAPQQGFNPSLSVGYVTATRDGKVLFQRRAPDVHCPNVLHHEPTGYMTSLAFAPRTECDNPKYAQDERLFDVELQLGAKTRELAETFGIPPESIHYQLMPDFLGNGHNSIEFFFSSTGKTDYSEAELRESLNDRIKKLRKEGNERQAKRLENTEFLFVPFEKLGKLIMNQGRLCKINPVGYRPAKPEEMPLIDESLLGLIYGYADLTGESPDIDETIARLNHEGTDIKVYNSSRGQRYNLPRQL
ncbi:MAG: hypothetical protein WC533_03715 [Candidatus Pacearchaeota archaeon]